MTPDEHYIEAERLLKESQALYDEQVRPKADLLGEQPDQLQAIVASFMLSTAWAQVHATLATVGERPLVGIERARQIAEEAGLVKPQYQCADDECHACYSVERPGDNEWAQNPPMTGAE